MGRLPSPLTIGPATHTYPPCSAELILVSWTKELPEPIRLRDGRELRTLSDTRALILGLADRDNTARPGSMPSNCFDKLPRRESKPI
jgi:hypothetical protein